MQFLCQTFLKCLFEKPYKMLFLLSGFSFLQAIDIAYEINSYNLLSAFSFIRTINSAFGKNKNYYFIMQ